MRKIDPETLQALAVEGIMLLIILGLIYAVLITEAAAHDAATMSCAEARSRISGVEVTALIVSQAVVTFGFALWSSIAFINNIHDFKGSASGVGRTMGMGLLDEHPAIPTPLKSRRVSNPLWSRMAVAVIASLQMAIALLLWAGGAVFIFAEPGVAKPIATLGFAGLSGLCFIFLLSGMWFAYGIRQDILQLTHIGLLVTSIAAIVIMQL